MLREFEAHPFDAAPRLLAERFRRALDRYQAAESGLAVRLSAAGGVGGSAAAGARAGRRGHIREADPEHYLVVDARDDVDSIAATVLARVQGLLS